MLQPVLSKDKKTQEYPKKSDPPCKDKFLVQSVLRSFVRDDEALWETRNKKETTLVRVFGSRTQTYAVKVHSYIQNRTCFAPPHFIVVVFFWGGLLLPPPPLSVH